MGRSLKTLAQTKESISDRVPEQPSQRRVAFEPKVKVGFDEGKG